jgi:hypothetical protein
MDNWRKVKLVSDPGTTQKIVARRDIDDRGTVEKTTSDLQ